MKILCHMHHNMPNMSCLGCLVSEPSPCGHGHVSEQEEEEEEDDDDEGAGLPQQVPQTPDQEAFLKQHFVTLAELCSTGKRFNSSTACPQQLCHRSLSCDHLNCVSAGSPSRMSHSSNESLSISSRFLSCQSSSAR